MIQYISYADLNEFYSIKEVCRLLEMDVSVKPNRA